LEGGTVFLIQNGSRAGFRTEAEYLTYGYNFSHVVYSNQGDNSLPFQTIRKAMEGTLVIDAQDNRTVYMVGLNATKRGFTSSTVFNALGYKFANLPKINLSDYPAGAPIGDVNQPHPDGALVKEGNTIWWIRNGQKSGFDSMLTFNTYGFSLSRVVPANAADVALAEGPMVMFRDGTLVVDGSAYYIISEGKKRPFPTYEVFIRLGFKEWNAVRAGLAGYVQGTVLQ
jgi:hypothetical protein